MNQVRKRSSDRVAGMHVRSYYARSIEEAVDRATCEMGPEAMLIDSRRTPAESRHIGEYEVRFASAGKPKGAAQAADGGLAEEVARMRAELGEMRDLVRRGGPQRCEPDREIHTERLLEAGFAPELARELAAAERSAEEEIRVRLAADTGNLPVVAVMGPPGSGKTTALVKMAVRHCAGGRGPVVLVNTDTWRIGAPEQMARYASILGVALLTADTAGALRQAIDSRAENTLMLIDTPGLSGGDMEMFESAGSYLAGRSDVDRQLVLPATMHWSDMERACERYQRYRPTRLAFTHLDETDRFGGVLTAACMSGMPVAWISAGQRIPDDLEPATPESLCRLAARLPADAPAGVVERTAS